MTVTVIVLLIGFGLWAHYGSSFDPPVKTTTTVEVGTGGAAGKRVTKTETTKDAGPKAKTGTTSSTEVETPQGSPAEKRQTVSEEGSRSLPERVLGESGRDLLQIAAILLTAFLAGAFTQRLLLGDFAFKLGPLDLGPAQEDAEDALVALTAKVVDSAKRVDKERERLDALAQTLSSVTLDSLKTGQAVAQLRAEVDALKSKPGGS